VIRWRIRRIVNGCAAQQLLVRRDVFAPEFIHHVLARYLNVAFAGQGENNIYS